jgi:hypothetical protein
MQHTKHPTQLLEPIMKNISFNKIAIVAVSFFAIATSNAFADPTSQPYQLQSAVVSVPSSQVPVTRAQVKNELQQLEAAGFNPAADYENYPDNLQAAERAVGQQQAALAAATVNSVGSDGGTVSAAGASSK